MQIGKKCWEKVVAFLGEKGERGPLVHELELLEDEDEVSESLVDGSKLGGEAQLVFQT
jgi:hypothetical protein